MYYLISGDSMIYSAHTARCQPVLVPFLSTCLSMLTDLIVCNAQCSLPLLMTFFSAHHSPSTVNMNASEFVIGTVRLNSTLCQNSVVMSVEAVWYSPALPIKMKNHTLPVTLSSNGTA